MPESYPQRRRVGTTDPLASDLPNNREGLSQALNLTAQQLSDLDVVQLLSPKEFGQVARMSLSTVRRRLAEGALPAIQLGGPGTMWQIDLAEFLRRIASATGINTSLPQQPCTESTDPESEADAVRQPKSGPLPLWMVRDQAREGKR
jgi:hypothetical protein